MARYMRTDFLADYPDDAACLLVLLRLQRGGRDLFCPACSQRAKFHPITNRRAFACQECGHHIFPCAGTVFERSSTPLTKWFLAIYLMTGARGHITARELQRQLGVTYKTAWRIRHELGRLMASADYRGALAGQAEELN